MPKVSLQNVTKTYGKIRAVDDLTLEVGDGEFVSILGKPGSGKSTILRLISGLEIPDAGNIYIGDTLVNDIDPSKRQVSMVFQSFALYPHLTAYDNLAFPLKKQHLSQDQIRSDVSEVAKLLGISQLLEKKPGQLSGGEKQRLAIGRSLVRKPLVLLMDNPLSNLDAQLRLHMRTELKRIHREFLQTIIF
jgi:multiple sugar transport system ATP-binding protein